MSRQRFFIINLLIIALSLVLVACVRPLPNTISGTTSPPDRPVYPASEGSIETAPDGEVTPSVPYPPAETIDDAIQFTEEAYPADSASLEEGYPSPEDEIVGGDNETAVAPVEEAPSVSEDDSEVADGEPAAATENDVTTESEEQSEADSTAETTEEAVPTGPIEYVVGPGETLFNIGLQYNMSWVLLAEYNNLTNPNSLSPGQVILIPTLEELNAAAQEADPDSETTPTAEETAVSDEVLPAEFEEYIVQAGDNLYRISLQYGLSWVELANANDLTSPTQLEEGQTLLIPIEQE